jgi:hypothetical protein
VKKNISPESIFIILAVVALDKLELVPLSCSGVKGLVEWLQQL